MLKKRETEVIRQLVEGSIRKGYLDKRGPKQNDSWKRRWFVLKAHTLYYFENDQELKLLGKFVLDKTCSVIPSKEAKKDFCMRLTVNSQPRLLSSDSQQIRQDWINDITACIKKESEKKKGGYISGYLSKQGPKGGAWKKRYCVLDGLEFSYYKQQKDVIPAGIINLAQCTGIRVASELKELCLEIELPTRKYQFLADNFKLLEAWSYELKRCLVKEVKNSDNFSGSHSSNYGNISNDNLIEPPKVILPSFVPVEEAECIPKLQDLDISGIPITNIANHIDKLSKLINPSRDDITGYLVEYNYAEEKSVPQMIAFQEQNLYAVALDPVNATKNRYNNVLPPEHSRVKLKPIPNQPGSDYINANFIDGLAPGTSNFYVAAQGPLPTTVIDFWRMIWELESTVVIMLTREVESGVDKCTRYWPLEGETLELGEFEVSLFDLEQTTQTKQCISRELVIVDSQGNRRNIKHVQYIEWPDHGIPESTNLFLEVVQIINQSNPNRKPVIVHCSAGLGRTGTLIMVHSILEKVYHEVKVKRKSPEQVLINIPQTLIQFRSQRPMMIQTDGQYEFCYLAIHDGIENILGSKSSIRLRRATNHYQKFSNMRSQFV